ncbi:pentatricopeptide repeat-containing protein At1g74900, mitochondrial-like [Dioscorea cayenensis subsp. rotundata]|uniref:Pentatricopeptide repeat-containing protein At1g74900, mitochondrial-like n=1 Tax=Dioscorea cayennensis subsp. rotundata TaxID=55577 RepID=A0AB40B4H9_DIOCR|nr:pentatricopeptide repeat-containing protein At1g74900, mitochondrial-like [Dioscorea cayenensis subsp. rotundata]
MTTKFTKFAEVVKHFFQRSCSSSFSSCLEIGARPRHPHPFEYNKLMKAFARAGQPDDVLRLLDEMRQSNFELDVPCYTTAIDSLVVARRFEEAEAVFKDMVSSGLIPDVASCTVLVKMYSCYLKQFNKACLVLQWMVRLGCKPDVVAYSTLIAGLCQAGKNPGSYWCPQTYAA